MVKSSYMTDQEVLKAGSDWSRDIKNAWDIIVPEIQRKVDIKKENILPLSLLVVAVGLYFRYQQSKNTNIFAEYPTGQKTNIDWSIDENLNIIRNMMAEFYLIPKSAIPYPEFDKEGFDIDVIRLFNLEDLKHG